MRSCSATVEQTGRGYHESSRTDRYQARTTSVRAAKGVDHCFGDRRARLWPCRDDDRVSRRNSFEAVAGLDFKSPDRAQASRYGRTDAELVPPVDIEFWPRQCEDLDDDTELERSAPVEDERGNSVRHNDSVA